MENVINASFKGVVSCLLPYVGINTEAGCQGEGEKCGSKREEGIWASGNRTNDARRTGRAKLYE